MSEEKIDELEKLCEEWNRGGDPIIAPYATNWIACGRSMRRHFMYRSTDGEKLSQMMDFPTVRFVLWTR